MYLGFNFHTLYYQHVQSLRFFESNPFLSSCFNMYLWNLHNGLFREKLCLVRPFRHLINVVFCTSLCLRLLPETFRDFLNLYLGKLIVHMPKLRHKSLLKIRMATCIHCAPGVQMFTFLLLPIGRTHSIGTDCVLSFHKQTACLKSSAGHERIGTERIPLNIEIKFYLKDGVIHSTVDFRVMRHQYYRY